MPSFAYPALVLLLPLAPAIVWWWLRNRKPALRYSSTEALAILPPGRARSANFWGPVLRGGGLGLIILAMSGPRWPDPGSRQPTEGIAIAMVVDVSASMNEKDFAWHDDTLARLDGVKRVFRLFVSGGVAPGGAPFEARSSDLIGLVTFATHADTACPLTLDHEALLKILEAEEARTVAGESTTNPGDALAWALAFLHKAPTRRKIVIFLTDGESNVPPPALTPRQAGQLAGNLGIPIYALNAGPDSEKVNDRSEAAKTKVSLEEVALLSRGKYFRAQDGAALLEAVSDIDRLERNRIESFHYRHYHEGFAWVAFASLMCWVSLISLESTRWRRIPG